MLFMAKMYIHDAKDWPHFTWDQASITPLLGTIHQNLGLLRAKMDFFEQAIEQKALIDTLSDDIVQSSAIEGEAIDQSLVRSSIARRFGVGSSELYRTDRHIEGLVDITLDATQNHALPMTKERLFSWHNALFPTGRGSLYKIIVGDWRNDAQGRMRVISGPMGREKIHFIAPAANRIELEMGLFIDWFNLPPSIDVLVQAAICHIWFITIHPFEDGNGRIARALTDLILSRLENSEKRFYSLSSQIKVKRKKYYEILEHTQKGNLDITSWICWFLETVKDSIERSESIYENIVSKARFWRQQNTQQLNPRQRKVINLFLEKAVERINSSKWAKITQCSQDTALRDINDLIERQILRKSMRSGRSTSYSLIH
jgi:Fic family protein